MADDDEQTVDDKIRTELMSTADGGDSTGADVQNAVTSPTGLPDYLSFLGTNAPAQPDTAKPADLSFLGVNLPTGGSTPDSTAPDGKVSGSVSYKGSTEHGKKYAGGLFGQADKAVDQFSSQDDQRVAQEQARADAHYKNAEDAAAAAGKAATDYADRDREVEQQIIDFNNHAAATEERMYGEAKAERARYLASYQEQLAGVRELAKTTGNPLSDVGKGGAIGLMGAEFAQGFLAARGIKIDVTGQIDRWVDRSIQEHQTKIQNARASAEDQLHLYEIARQNSHDDWEARQRYRGFVIEGLKTAVQMNANRFQSQLAAAQAQESVAKLQIESDTTARQIADAHFNRVHQMMTTEFDRAYKQGMLGIEQYKAETARKAEEKKNAVAAPLTINDPRATTRDANGKIISTKIVAQVDPTQPKEIQDAIHKRVTDVATTYGQIGTALDRVRKLRAPAFDDYTERFGPKAGKERFSEDYRNYEREVKEAMMDARHAIAGSNLTENEKKEWDSMLPDEKGFQSGDNAAAVDQLEMHFRDRFLGVVNNTSGIIPASGERPYIDASNDTSANYNARFNSAMPSTKVINQEEGQAVRGSAEQVEAGDKTTPGQTSAYNDFSHDSKYKNTSFAAGGEPRYAKHLETMALAAVDPARVLKEHNSDEDPAQVQADAISRLEYISKDETVPYLRREYAGFLAKHAKENPDELLKELAPMDLKFH